MNDMEIKKVYSDRGQNAIYMFWHEQGEGCYVGSTFNFKERMWAHNQHRKQKKYNHTDLYTFMNENKVNDIRKHLHILEYLPDDCSKAVMRDREQMYIELFQPNLNMFEAVSARARKKRKLNNMEAIF